MAMCFRAVQLVGDARWRKQGNGQNLCRQVFILNQLLLPVTAGQCKQLHAGLFSWWVMQGGHGRAMPGRVFAVEPLPANLAQLRTNIHQAGLTHKV